PGQSTHPISTDAAAHSAEVRDDLAPPEAAELRHVARQVADFAFHVDRVAHAVEAEDVGRSRGGADEAHQHPDRGRLAGAVRPEVAEHLLLCHLQVELEKTAPAAIVLGQTRGPYRGQCQFRPAYKAT